MRDSGASLLSNSRRYQKKNNFEHFENDLHLQLSRNVKDIFSRKTTLYVFNKNGRTFIDNSFYQIRIRIRKNIMFILR